MPQIRPITELRNTGEISDLVNSIDEPLFITKNGYGDMVIMSNATYENEIALVEIYRKLLIGQKQIDSGEVVDSEKAFQSLRKKYDYKV